MLREILENGEPYKISDLKISGKNLINMGISGEKIGETLEYLRKSVVYNPEQNKKSVLLQKSEEFNRN